MPQAERPSSPDEPSSDQYYIYRLEQDLYELFEEQQLLLDIVAQQQERLEHQLEVQRLLTSEPVRRVTPVPEQEPVPLDDRNLEVDAEPEQSVPAAPELLAIAEGDEVAVPSSELVPQLPDLVVGPEPVSEPDIDLFEVAEQRPPTPSTPELELELQLALNRETPPCQLERPTRCGNQQVTIPYVQDTNVGKCTPPKRSGLGYDMPFPYPRHMVKSRERRALFIFTLATNMVMQLQRCVSLAEMGLDSVYIVELETAKPEPPPPAAPVVPVSTGALPKTKPKPKPLWKPKPKSSPNMKSSGMDIPVKRSYIKPAKRLHKQAKLTALLLDPEIDLDCEFGMDHIKKFRADRVREDEEARLRAMHPYQNQRQMVHMKLVEEVETSESEEQDGEQLADALASLAISEDSSQSHRKQVANSWFDQIQIFNDRSQAETRACTPNAVSYPLLQAGLHSDTYNNPIPSTSAQALALSLSMAEDSPPIDHQLPRYTNDSQLSLEDQFAKLTTNDYEGDSRGSGVRRALFDAFDGVNNINTPFGGYQLLRSDTECPNDGVQSPLLPIPPPPSPMYNQHFTYDSIASKENNNDGVQSTPMDIGEDDYARP